MITDDEIERLLDLSESREYEYAPSKHFYASLDDLSIQPGKNARLLILNYADYFSKKINGYLRKNNKGKKTNLYYEFYRYLLDKSLIECPSFSNKQVYRMDNPILNIDLVLYWYKSRIGETICYQNFLSTTKDLRGQGSLYLSNETRGDSSGKNIEPFLPENKARAEREVLFRSRSKFEIRGVNKKEKKSFL